MIDSILQTAALAIALASLVLHGRRLKAAGPGFAGVLAGLVGLTIASALPLVHSAAGSPQGGAAGWIAAGALAILAAGLAAWLPGLAARRTGAPASDGGGSEGREDPVLAEAQRLGRFGYWATDAQAGQVRMAPLAFELAGRPARAAISVEEMRSYIHPDDRERYFRLRQIAAERREPLVSEHRYLRPDGSTRWIRVEGNPRYAADGSFLGYVGFLQDVTARRDAEEALRASEARYRSISELLWGFTYVYRLAADGKWEREWISEESFRRITGYEWEEVRADLSFYHPDDRERARRDVDAAFSGEANQGEYRVLTRDGRTRWLSVRRRPEIDPATGRTSAVYGAAEDVTDRRESQEALRASEEQLRTLFTFSPVGIARNAMDGTFVEANPAMLRMVGYTEEELRTVRYWDLTPRKYEEQEVQQLDLLRTKGRYGPYEKEYVAKDGRSVPVNLHGALVTGQDGRQYIWSMVEDIAGRKASADALRRSETRYRKISEMIWGYSFANAVGADGAMTCEWMTEGAFRRTTGYHWEEIGVGFDLYHPDDRERARRDVARTIAGEPAHGEYRITTKSGAIRWLSIRRSVDTDPATGRVTMLYGAAEDVSDRKASEDALRLSEARYRKISEMIWGYSYAYAVGADGSLSCEWMTETAFRRVTGYRWEEIGVGFSLYHPDDQESARRDVARSIAGEATHGEYRIKCKDGTFRWLSVRRSIDIDPATGRVAMLYGAAEDITERKESQEALRRSEARFRGFAESASDWYWEQDADLRLSYISASNEALSGMRPEEHYGKTRREVWPLDVSEEQMAAHEADLAARRPFRDFRFARIGRDGKKRFLVLSGQPVFDAEGRFAGYRGIGRDITALVELERRAQEADARLVQAVEALDDGFVLTDPDDRIVVGNRNFRRLNADVAEQVQPGRLFIDHLRQRIALGLIPDAAGDPEAWLRKRMASRRSPAGSHGIRSRFDGTWLLVKDQRLPDGSTITVLVDITEQKRREIALQESEERYALAVAGVRDGIWDWLIDEKRLFVSARSAEILGQPQGEGWRHSDSFSDCLDPGERARYADALRAHLSGAAGHFAFEGRFVRADGSPLWGLIRGLSKRDASGRTVRMSGSLTDVTERRERDAQLERQREQLLDAQRLARLGYFTFDRATGASVWSETMAEIMGTKAAELRTSFDSFLSHLHIDDRQLYVRLRQECFARREPVRAELRVVRPGAETRWIDIQTRPLFDAAGALVGSHGVVFDITDRMAAAEALRRTNEDLERLVSERTRHLEAEITERRYAQAALTESEQRLKDIVAASSDWFWELDADLRVTSFSDVFYRTTGASPDATVGRHYAAWAPPADAAASMRSQWTLLARAIESRQPFRNVAYQLRAADGGTLHVRLGGVPVLHDGKFAGMRGSGTDVTELKDAQDALMQSEKMSSIATMVAGISHEINTPIGVAVTGSSHLSEHVRTFVASYRSGPLKRTTLDALLLDLDEGLRIIGSNLRRAADLVQSFKQVSVDQVSGISRVIDLALYLREIVGTLSPQLRGSGITVAIECPDGVLLTTYPGAISQIVTNLVMNSLVHGFDPGASGRLTLAVSAGERDVEIVYADDGNGVSEDVLQRMFEPFFTTRRGRGGSGLGLSIVYNLVTQKLGGEIRAEGAPGKGLRFTIRLPRKAPVAADALT